MELPSVSFDSPVVWLVLLLAAGWFAQRTYGQIQLEKQRSVFKAQHGCKPAVADTFWSDPTGFGGLYRMIKAARSNRLLELWDLRFEELGPTYVVNRRGGMLVMSMDPDNVKSVLATRFDDWIVEPMRIPSFGPLLGKGIFTTDGAFWAHSRALLRPQFERSQVSELDQFESHISALLAQIPKDGSTVDLQELFHRFTMDTSTEFLTGTSTHSLDDEKNVEAKKFVDAFEYGTHDAMNRARFGSLYYLTPHQKGTNAIKTARAAVDSWVDGALEYKKAVAEGKKPAQSSYIFLNELAADDRVDALRIKNETLNILLAGRDTTASLLSDLWFTLAREPEVFAKLQAEVDGLHGELPSYERLRDMKYVKWCAQETLRLYPPVPALAKIAGRDTFIPHGGGPDGRSPIFVPKGGIFAYNFRAMMRNPSVFGADAEKFRPERWADPSLRPGWNFVPFSGGPRVCLGQQYALTETYYVTIRLMQHFRKIEDRDGQPWQEKMSITCCSLNGTKVALYQ